MDTLDVTVAMPTTDQTRAWSAYTLNSSSQRPTLPIRLAIVNEIMPTISLKKSGKDCSLNERYIWSTWQINNVQNGCSVYALPLTGVFV
jgi:hypothetical protein